MTGLLRVLTLVAMLISAGGALADKKTGKQARVQFRLGVELFNEGKYDQAVIAFERAYELKPSFKILYNIAQTENELGHYAAALAAYERYLSDGGDLVPVSRRPKVEAEIERLRGLVGSVSVSGAENGTQVFVDNRSVGEIPLAEPIVLSIGDHEVLLKREGKEIHREIVRVGGGKESTVHYQVPVVETSVSPPPPPVQPEAEPKPPRVWTWVALGIGGAAGITGAVLGGVALGESEDIKGQCTEDKHCPEFLADDRDRVKGMSLAADILFGVAGVGVAAAITLFFLEPRLADKRSETEVVAAPTVTADSLGVSVTGRF